MGFFRELPNIEYLSVLSDRDSSLDYIKVKNLFRRVKVRDDLKKYFTIFDRVTIKDGARPDQVADTVYGNAELDWVVLITAGIINVNNEWPLNSYELYNYSLEKYGALLNATKHYETIEIRDQKNRLILPKGKIVDSDFSIPNPSNPLTDLTGNAIRIGISYYEYETRLNEEKRQIDLLKPRYLDQFLKDMRKIMKYSRSSQYVSTRLIKTSNTRIKSP
ncbi:MAG: hypothetical protein CM15mV1_0870 [uncultured marine virus]|nr:MAG: hypothetical protein CM15mV1_0870 [uncultured marine virus]